MAQAKQETKTNKQPITLSPIQCKATNALIASLEELSPIYGNVARLEDKVQAELVIFYSKFKVEPRSKGARKLNSTAKVLLVKYCPNMPINTVRLMIKCAQSSTSVDKLKIKTGTLSAKTVLDTFTKAKDNTNTKGRKLSLTGYLRRELPTKTKATGNKVTKVAELKVTLSEDAKVIVADLMDPILDVLTQNNAKVEDLDKFREELTKLIDQHILDAKAA